jgi:hypothetical protein
MTLWRRRRKAGRTDPPAPPPNPEATAAAERAEAGLQRAHEQLREARERSPRVAERAIVARRQLRENGLGELIENALGLGSGGA